MRRQSHLARLTPERETALDILNNFPVTIFGPLSAVLDLPPGFPAALDALEARAEAVLHEYERRRAQVQREPIESANAREVWTC